MKTNSKIKSPREKASAKGKIRWYVYGNIAGQKYRRYFDDKTEAEKFYEDLLDKEANHLAYKPRIPTTLTTQQVAEAEAALTLIMKMFGHQSILRAVNQISELCKTEINLPLQEAIDDFLETKENLGINRSDQKKYGLSLVRFKAANPHVEFVRQIGPKEIRNFFEYISSETNCGKSIKGEELVHGCTKSSYKKNRARFVTFIRWLKESREGFALPPYSILSEFPYVETDQNLIKFMTPDEAQQLMDEAETFEQGTLINYFSHTLFLPIRSDYEGEIFRLGLHGTSEARWDIENKLLYISGKIAKKFGLRRTARKRRMELTPPWLRYQRQYPLLKYPIIPPMNAKNPSPDARIRLKNALERFRRKTSLNLEKNIIRHSAITYLLVRMRSFADTAKQAGNSERVIRDHYDGNANERQAKTFYAIAPKATRLANHPAND